MLLRLRGGGGPSDSNFFTDFVYGELLTPEEKTTKIMSMSRDHLDSCLRTVGQHVDNNDTPGRVKMTLCRVLALPLPDVSAITVDAGRYIVEEWWQAPDAPPLNAKRGDLHAFITTNRIKYGGGSPPVNPTAAQSGADNGAETMLVDGFP